MDRRNTRSVRRPSDTAARQPSAPRILNAPLLSSRLASGRENAPDSRPESVRADNIALQTALGAIGCGTGVADGVWGAQSRRGARCFQRTIGAAQTGLLADDQIAWLNQLANPSRDALDSSALARVGTPPPDSSDVALAPTELEQTEPASPLQTGDEAEVALDAPAPPIEDDAGAAEADAPVAAAEATPLDEPSELAAAEDPAAPAIKDPVGLPDLRIDVGRERATVQPPEPCLGDASAASAECATDEMNRTDTPDAVAEAWRDQDNRIAAAFGDKPAPTKEAVALPEAAEASEEDVRRRARQSEIARLAPLLGLDPAELTGSCRQGMRERQATASPMTTMFNRVCRAHAYAIDDDMLKLGYDARLAAAGDRDAERAMEERRRKAEKAREAGAATTANPATPPAGQ